MSAARFANCKLKSAKINVINTQEFQKVSKKFLKKFFRLVRTWLLSVTERSEVKRAVKSEF